MEGAYIKLWNFFPFFKISFLTSLEGKEGKIDIRSDYEKAKFR